MRETEADPIPNELKSPLPLQQLPASVAKLIAAAAPMKTMAARGIAPLKPAELAVAIYQLSFDTDEGVSGAADAAPSSLPDAVLGTILKAGLPPCVLHFFGIRLPPQREAAIEAVLYNADSPDATFVALASRVPERLVEIIFANETRLLRAPAIVKALFANKAARMSSVNRALELCARHNVVVDVPGFEEIVAEIRQTPEALSASADAAFAALAEAVAEPGEAGAPSALDAVTEADESTNEFDAEADTLGDAPALNEAEAPPHDGTSVRVAPEKNTVEKGEKKRAGMIDFTKLRIYEKVRMATIGNSYCRTNLIRDVNRLVAMAVIKSPMITDSEVIAAAANKAVHEDVIRYIAGSRDFTAVYAIRWNLVNNPKCPLTLAMRFLPALSKQDIKKLAKSKNVSAALTVTARRLVGAAQK
jgi:hypothetical protein